MSLKDEITRLREEIMSNNSAENSKIITNVSHMNLKKILYI